MKCHWKAITAVSVLYLSSSGLLSAQVQRAVCVGVNDYETGSDLRGCVNDATSMAQILVDRYGFSPENIVMLKDREATSARIKGTVESHLVEKSKPGDVAVFFFSGHGSRVPDDNGDESDGYDESVCPTDFSRNPRTWYRDDVLNYQLSRINTERVFVMLDTCHSGTATRSIDPVGETNPLVKYLDLGFSPSKTRSARADEPMGFVEKNTPKSHVIMTSCSSSEKSLEHRDKSTALFAGFVHEFLVAEDPKNVTLGTIRNNVSPKVSGYIKDAQNAGRLDDYFSQTPQYEGDDSISFADLLMVDSNYGQGQPTHTDHSTTAPAPPEGYSGGEIDVTISTDQSEYQYSDRMKIRVSVGEPCYLLIAYKQADDTVVQLLPNRFQQANRTTESGAFVVPGDGADFALEIGKPPGGEFVFVIASTEQFDTKSLKSWGDGDFVIWGGDEMSFKDVKDRGVEVVPAKARSGFASAFVSVSP